MDKEVKSVAPMSGSAPVKPGGGTSERQETACQSPEQQENSRVSSASPAVTQAETLVRPGGELTYVIKARPATPQVPGYKCLRELGNGTYGEVWLAENESTGVKVGIKFLHRDLGQQWQLLQAEVRQLALLYEDPGIIQLIDFDPDASRPYYIMAFAEGGSLADRLKEGPLPLADALPMFRRIAEAMAYVHAKGIRHCDLKPANILLDRLGKPRVADFGQAHLASELSPALGTFFYMAPEQAQLSGQIPDTRWDVYGLGALFYAMITGNPPHEDSSLKTELQRTEHLPARLKIYRETMRNATPPTAHKDVAGMDGRLADIIDHCLKIDPNQRFRSAQAIVTALGRRQRLGRQRAILYAGLFVPVALLILLGTLGFVVAHIALERAKESLVEQTKENYKVSARLAADRVKSKVSYYLKELQKQARDEDLIKALAVPKPNNTTIEKKLKAFRSAIVARPEPLYMLLSETGNSLGAYPPDPANLGHQFGWRNYFHGEGDDDWAAAKAGVTKSFEPISMLHISRASVHFGQFGRFGAQLMDSYTELCDVLWADSRRTDNGEHAARLFGRSCRLL